MQPAPALPAVEYAERSDPGRDPDKQVNEDACGHGQTRFGHLCVVCDGMGGHAAGREAAELALGAIFEMFERAADGTPPGQVLKSAIEEASQRVHFMRTSEVAMGRPGSTVVAVLMHARGTEVAHVGDSRAYLLRQGQIFRITRDHSIVQELVDRGLLTQEQAAHHPDANRITRALGIAPDVEAELRPQPIEHRAGDTFVLCSDGLCDLVDDREILDLAGSAPPAQAVGTLVDLANARGGHDNITVVILRARESAIATASPPPPAPTYVQGAADTLVSTAVDTAPAASGHRVERPTEPLLAAPAVIPKAPEPTAPPSQDLGAPHSGHPVVVAAIVLAAFAVVALGAVLLVHLRERSGKPSDHGALAIPVLDAQTAPATTLVPGSVTVPEASAPADPIAPLQPTRRKTDDQR